mgnify:CR=1 FL=1
MMVQGAFIYYGLKNIIHWDPFTAGIFVITINTGAYMAEIVRSGIQSVDKGQTEAARSIGMNSIQTMVYIILPQAIKNSFPSIGNEFVINIKDSSVLNVIAVTELFYQAKSVAGSLYAFVPTYFVVALIYLCLTFPTTRILNYIENRMIFKQRRKVDLPLPLAPIIVTTSPFETVKSISCNTSKLPNDFFKCLTSIINSITLPSLYYQM